MSYAILKLLHLISVIIFLGNVFTGMFWMAIAMKTNDARIVHHSIKGVIKSDRLFTIPSVILITIAGLSTAEVGHLSVWRTGWILWAIILFTASGIAFSWKIGPLQKRLYRLSDPDTAPHPLDWQSLRKAHRSWSFWGLFALVTPFAALVMMILKVPK